MRIPFTAPLPSPRVIPPSATDLSTATLALSNFLRSFPKAQKTVLLTGAGISVPSGLADYRGSKGTYTTNPAHRPIYYTEFLQSHEARKRYWARSFLGWPAVEQSQPNAAHHAIAELDTLGLLAGVITQNVDSFHRVAHPRLHTVEIHGALRALVCVGCRSPYPRTEFQTWLARLNPAWKELLDRAIRAKQLASDEEGNPVEKAGFGIKTNPDGDVDLPGAPYTTFRYPACPKCLQTPRPSMVPGGPREQKLLETTVDKGGGWTSGPGVLKPGVIMFGENVYPDVKASAFKMISKADQMLVIGSSLATMSALSLVRRARGDGKTLGILNLGGVREESDLFEGNEGGIRLDMPAEQLLPATVKALREVKI